MKLFNNIDIRKKSFNSITAYTLVNGVVDGFFYKKKGIFELFFCLLAHRVGKNDSGRFYAPENLLVAGGKICYMNWHAGTYRKIRGG